MSSINQEEDYISFINKIVKKVIKDENGNREFSIPRYTEVENYKEFELEEEFKDETREFKGIMTDMVVKDFLKDPDKVYDFLRVVYNTFHDAVYQYLIIKGLPKPDPSKGYPGGAFFTVKGGNVLRLVSNEFEDELPGNARSLLEDYYGKFFKRSDADFTIYIDPSINNYDEVFEEMIYLGYLIQVYLRKYFQRTFIDSFDYFGYNDEKKKQILLKFLEEMNNAYSLKDEGNSIFFGGKFTKLEFDGLSAQTEDHSDLINFGTDTTKYGKLAGVSSKRGDISVQKIPNTNKIAMFQLGNEINNLYIGVNESLDFMVGPNKDIRMKFALDRTKINFVAYFVREDESGRAIGTKFNFGGELIDCSIVHKDTSSIPHFFHDIKAAIRDYRIEGRTGKLSFRGYSLKY
jgi:hypothetical protein